MLCTLVVLLNMSYRQLSTLRKYVCLSVFTVNLAATLRICPHWGCSASKNRLPSMRASGIVFNHIPCALSALPAYNGCMCLFDAVLVNLASMGTSYGISCRIGFN